MLRLNRSYGQREILLAYAKHADRPVHAFLQHGWTLQPDAGSGRYANSKWFRSAPRLYWSERQRGEAMMSGVPHAVVAAAPFLYLLKMRQVPFFIERGNLNGERVLIYPRHSAEFTPRAAVDQAVTAASRAVAAGRKVTVCLHPVDARRREVIERYASLGCSVTQHGTDRYDSNFLVRQLDQFLNSDVVWSYGLGSAALYACAAGLPVLFPSADGDVSHTLPASADFGIRQDVYSTLLRHGSLARFARLELGTDHMLSPEAMSALLGVTGMRSWQARGLHAAGRAQGHLRYRLLGDATAKG